MADPDSREKPLVPATATGTAIIGIPLASILAAIGWTGQKILALDEQLVQVRQHQEHTQNTLDVLAQFVTDGTEKIAVLLEKARVAEKRLDRIEEEVIDVLQGNWEKKPPAAP